jgi:hypothetical protein
MVVECWKDLLKEEYAGLVGEGGDVPFMERLKQKLLQKHEWTKDSRLPNPPFTVRVLDGMLAFEAQHANVAHYSNGNMVVKFYVTETKEYLKELVGREMEVTDYDRATT